MSRQTGTDRPLAFMLLVLLVSAVLGYRVAGAAGTPGPANGVETTAAYAILVDVDTNTILYEKNADQLMAPASMAKLMTQEVVFNEIVSGRLTLDSEFPVSEYAWRTGGAPSGGSTMFAQLNSRIKVGDLLKGAIIVSANDGCIALAEGISGSEPAFATRMTRRAREIGLTQSVFSNSTGLPDPGTRMTARELARLAVHIIKTYPQFYPLYGEKQFQWNVRRPQENRNPLLREVAGADGLKTGATDESGFGLVGSVLRDGQRLVLVVNGLKTTKERAAESRKLIEWGFRSFRSQMLVSGAEPVGEARIFGGASGYVGLAPAEDVKVLVPREADPRDIHARVVYSGPIRAPVSKGQEIAKLQVFNGKTLATERPLVATDDVGEGTLPQKALDGALELVKNLFRAKS